MPVVTVVVFGVSVYMCVCMSVCVCVCVCACVLIRTSFLLQINGKDISWQHLVKLYEENAGQSTDTLDLVLLHKVKYDHVYLNSYSKMKVNLAAQVFTDCYAWSQYDIQILNQHYKIHALQVLSTSVGHAMELMGDPAMSETIRFVKMFDRWFDCLNVGSMSEGK